MKKLLLILAFLGLFIGCDAVPFISPIVTGVVMWVEREAHKYYHDDTEIVYRAVKRACVDLGYEISRDTPDEDGSFYLVAGSNDRFKIRVRRVENDITKLSVRVNIMGDRPYAELLYKKVDEQLGVIEFDPDGNPTRFRGSRIRRDS